jgi:hypothetical protein
MSNIPAATQRFDQLDARRHLLHPEVHRRPLIAQQSGLCSDHIEVWGIGANLIQTAPLKYLGNNSNLTNFADLLALTKIAKSGLEFVTLAPMGP